MHDSSPSPIDRPHPAAVVQHDLQFSGGLPHARAARYHEDGSAAPLWKVQVEVPARRQDLLDDCRAVEPPSSMDDRGVQRGVLASVILAVWVGTLV